MDLLQQFATVLSQFLANQIGGFAENSIVQFLNNDAYRAGFRDAAIWMALVAGGTFLVNRGTVFLDKTVMGAIRPTKKPGKMPTEDGPSPAGMTLRMVLGLLGVAAVLWVAIATVLTMVAA